MGIASTPETLRMLSEFFRRKPGVRLAYLFGSQARGQTTPRSDLDLAVEMDHLLPETDRTGLRIALLNELIDLLRSDQIDLVLLNEAPPLLRHRVAREGMLLHEDRPGLRVAFVVKTLRDYEDTRPLREIQARYLLQRLTDNSSTPQRHPPGEMVHRDTQTG
jgi:predicted nucleotidyltransferase